ncbi:MAG: NAD(P)-dependent oxidoreductase [Candidatus Atabeyarchaeum deiterrae]
MLVTGVCGYIGSNLVARLLKKRYQVRGLDLSTDVNRKVAENLQPEELLWGDVTDANMVKKAVDDDVEAVVHLAYILPPSSETKPELAQKVNINGTRNVVKAVQASGKKPKLIFTSSTAVFGMTADEKPPIRPDHPVKATNNYSRYKIQCEQMIKESNVRYTILRLAAVLPLEPSPESISISNSMPPSGRMEFLHYQDACTAILNCLAEKKTDNRVYTIGGGKKNQMLIKDMMTRMSAALGMPEPDWSQFGKKPYYLDWYDTTESQRILKYQKRTFDGFIEEFKKKLGVS